MRSVGYSISVMALAALAVGAWLIPAEHLGPSPPGNGSIAVAGLPPTLAAPPLESLTELTERPPFAASRRSLDAAGEDPTLILGQYRLSGVIVAPSRRSVILTGPAGSVTVSEGEAIDGWTLEAIDAAQIVFVSGNRRQEIPVVPSDR